MSLKLETTTLMCSLMDKNGQLTNKIFFHQNRLNMDDKKQVLFTFGAEMMEEIYYDCEDQINMSTNLIKHYFTEDKDNRMLLSLLCESYSLNYKLKYQIEGWYENMPMTVKDEKEIITVSQQEAMLMEASIFAREEIKTELRKHFHISNHYN